MHSHSGHYFPVCSRYIELNPVAAGMVRKSEQYWWSSYLVNAWGGGSKLIPYDEHIKLGSDSVVRCYSYRELFKQQLLEQDVHLNENVSDYCHPEK